MSSLEYISFQSMLAMLCLNLSSLNLFLFLLSTSWFLPCRTFDSYYSFDHIVVRDGSNCVSNLQNIFRFVRPNMVNTGIFLSFPGSSDIMNQLWKKPRVSISIFIMPTILFLLDSGEFHLRKSKLKSPIT